ncbi:MULTISPECIES: hypothetical protein [Aeromonas]|uniref:hypothetical protein n=1 Tax=Aeromonas TaxID=642 RepID=UPI000A7CB131|nr:hypothetical protein [Aeromonas caviae]MDX7785995.1 hypothetical protein [Aeromonas caviae]
MKGSILVLPVAIVLTGCGATADYFADNAFRMYMSKPLYDVKDNKEVLKPSLLNVVMKSDDGSEGIVSKKCFSVTSNDGECKQERNIAISTIMLTSEEICLIHRRNMYGNEAGSNLILGSFTNLFTGVSTVISPATSKSIFSALALFSNAERSLINESIYKEMLVSAIDNKIVTKRTEAAIDIFKRMDKTVEEYSVAQAMFDVTTFHSKCSFMEGLRYALIEGDGNPKARKADALKREINEVELKLQLQSNKDDAQLKERRVKLYQMLNELGAAVAESESAPEAEAG